MLAKTHIALGMASALIITQPATAPEVIVALTGGAIGGGIVDVDLNTKRIDFDSKNKEDVYNTIVNTLFISALIALDYFLDEGMSKYVISNWGVRVWGGLLGIIILMLLAHISNHRTFSHSFLGMGLFGVAVYFFCRPVALSFIVGYASHLITDFFNKSGLALFYPITKRSFSLKKFNSDNQKANKYMLWISIAINIFMGGFLFARDIFINGWSYNFIQNISKTKLWGFNAFQVYLILINLFTYIGFQRSYRKADRELLINTEEDIRIAVEFETWILNFMVFIGGGLGMLLSFVRNLCYPSGYNSVWWSFCYASNMFWFTIYCFICNPFNWVVSEIVWISLERIPFLVYILAINIIGFLLFHTFRNRKLDEYSLNHTLLFLVGALGGTIGGIFAILISRKTGKSETFIYVLFGFPIMLISQIVFTLYMLSVGIF